jgi:hypothetical protein
MNNLLTMAVHYIPQKHLRHRYVPDGVKRNVPDGFCQIPSRRLALRRIPYYIRCIQIESILGGNWGLQSDLTMNNLAVFDTFF